MAATDAKPIPIKNQALRLYFEIRKADGTLATDWAGADSQVSLDGGSYGACTNEATQIGSSGTGYVELTSGEMNADFVYYSLAINDPDALPVRIPIPTTEAGEIPADAAGIRAAVGMSSANLDTQLSTIDGNVDDILADTAVIGTAGAGLTAVPWNAAWDAEVQSEVADALTAYDPPTAAEMNARTLPSADYFVVSDYTAPANSDIAAIKGVTDDVAALLEDDGGTPRFTANALEEAPTGSGSGLDAEGVRAAIGLATANLDAQLADLPTNSELDARTLASASYATAAALADVDSTADAIKLKTDALPSDPADQSLVIGATDAILSAVGDVPTNAELATALGGADDATLAAIAALETHGDSAWATATGFSTHDPADVWAAETRTLTSFGTLIADIVTAVWGAATRTLSAFGFNVTVETNNDKSGYGLADGAITAAKIAADATTELQTGLATAAALATVDSNVGAVKTVTDDLAQMLEDDGGTPRYTVNALEQAPAGEGGGGSGSDPLTNAVPGAYEAGTAGYVLGQIPAIGSQTSLITANNVSYTAPVNPVTGEMLVVVGDSYTAAAGRVFPWANDDWAGWSLTTAQSITFRAKPLGNGETITKAVTAITDTQVRLELSSAESAAFTRIGREAYSYEVVAVLANGDVETLAGGKITTRRYVP